VALSTLCERNHPGETGGGRNGEKEGERERGSKVREGKGEREKRTNRRRYK